MTDIERFCAYNKDIGQLLELKRHPGLRQVEAKRLAALQRDRLALWEQMSPAQRKEAQKKWQDSIEVSIVMDDKA
jgi:hypothetical protein